MSEVFDLKARLQEMGIAPKKSLGQNFLVSKVVIEKIVRAVQAEEFRSLLEVGPGLGALTEPLLQAGLNPELIELDQDLVAYWRQRGLQVRDADALKLNWDALALQQPALLVSNLPYNISTNLIVDRCFGPLALKHMILMVQKEVAERFTAVPRTKAYGLLSVMVQLHFRLKRVADASPRDFFPAPKVASRVLLFERLPDPGLGRPFLTFVKAAFAFRRKYLLKNLGGVVDKSGLTALPGIFTELKIKDKARAEELSPGQFVQLFKKVYEH